jgi:hypothetical protein
MQKAEKLVVQNSGWDKAIQPELHDLQQTVARLNLACKTQMETLIWNENKK